MVKVSMEGEGHTQIAVTVPLFLKKLWRMVNDKEAEGIIGWNSAGDGFVIYDQLQFITKLLPQYFKHNNMASFIRQLNFYDFHKVAGIDKDEIHFCHNFFVKDLPETLVFIKRKCTSVKSKLTTNVKEEELTDLLNGVKELKTKHGLVDNELKLLKQENAALWNEINNLRVKHSKQTKVINKIIHFLISYMHSQNSLSKRSGVATRKCNQNNLKTGPTILEIGYHNHSTDITRQTKSPYTVEEPNGSIAYDVLNSPAFNMQPTIDSSTREILSSTSSQDRVPTSKKRVSTNTSGSLDIETLKRVKLENLRPNVLEALNIGTTSNVSLEISNSKEKEMENCLNTILNSKNDILRSSKSPFNVAKFNMSENTMANVLDNSRTTQENSLATTLNLENNNLESTKALESPNLDLYFSGNEDIPPGKSPVKYNKMIGNPKENLGLYLNNIQMELNSLQDMLCNLSSAELSNFCNLMETVEPEGDQENLETEEELESMDQVIKSEQMAMALGNTNECVSKDAFADELAVESNLNEENNENNNPGNNQFIPDNLIPEVLVDEYFNTDF